MSRVVVGGGLKAVGADRPWQRAARVVGAPHDHQCNHHLLHYLLT
ncbi:hypothetical protein [Mameliella sediminis]|nr:hypothetical protein [Mameliella sediminis]